MRSPIAAMASSALVLLIGGRASAEFSGTYTNGLLVVVEGTSDQVDRATQALSGTAGLGPEGRAPSVMFDTHALSGDACPNPNALAETPVRRTFLLRTAPPAGLVGPVPPGSAWDQAHERLTRAGLASTPDSALVEGLTAGGARLVAVEPDIQWMDEDLARSLSETVPTATGRPGPSDTHAVRGYENWSWPFRPPVDWHRQASELDKGLELVESNPPKKDADRVTIAHFDTGYMVCPDQGLPPHLDTENSWNFARACDGDRCQPEPHAEDTEPQGWPNTHGHGTGTLSILAGGSVHLTPEGRPRYDGYLGGAPFAHVVEYRLAEFVAIWRPVVVASALRWAADHDVDVVSMSMGGPPSSTLHDAVNDAYCRGVAMFTASGNNFTLPLIFASTPRTTVFPARYRRVVAVGGVTADTLTYAKAPWRWRYLIRPWTALMRGNFGPPWVMDETLVAWTPNVPWLDFRRADACTDTPSVRLNGGGTSAATPQVAAAAAQWLQYHREKFDGTTWRSWEKAESVYRALLDSGDTSLPYPTYGACWFGKGTVRAATAITNPMPSNLTVRPRAELDSSWVAFAILSVIGSPTKNGLQDPAFGNMLATEIAQLATGSAEMDALMADRSRLRPVLESIAANTEASSTLRAAAREALASSQLKE